MFLSFLRRWPLLLLLLPLGACGGPSAPPVEPQTSAPRTLKLLAWQAPTILNPHLATGFKDGEASRVTLEPLASFDGEGKLIPILAAAAPSLENGQVAKDGKSVVWKLKPGVLWSDGQPFSAEDVVFTYQFISDPKTGATSAGNYEGVESVTALDPLTVKVTFKQATSAWFLPFVGNEGSILPRHLFQNYTGEKARQAPGNLLPVGTGPYRVSQFKPGDVVFYEPNPHYREAKSLGFERLELKGGGDAVSAARAVLETGDADYAFNLQVESNLLKNLEGAGAGRLVPHLGSLGERILFNFTDPQSPEKAAPHPFLTDAKVRRAFTLAVDRALIARQFYGVTGQATANVVLAPQEFVSSNTQIKFDLTQAAQLLDQAGWQDKDGDGVRDKNGAKLRVVFQTSVNPLRQKTQQVVKQALQGLGVEVELKSVDPSVFFSGDPANPDTLERFNADLQMFTTGNTNPDPGKYLKTFTCPEIPSAANNWSGDNYSRFCQKEYDQLWRASQQERNPERRRRLLIQMNDLLVKNYVLIPLVHRADVAGVAKTLQGVNLTPWDRNTWNIGAWRQP